MSAVAISQEYYVANEETVILVAFLVFATFIGRTISGPYKEWADGQIEVRGRRSQMGSGKSLGGGPEMLI